MLEKQLLESDTPGCVQHSKGATARFAGDWGTGGAVGNGPEPVFFADIARPGSPALLPKIPPQPPRHSRHPLGGSDHRCRGASNGKINRSPKVELDLGALGLPRQPS